jgi:CRP-like cAMP-binding protein
MHLVGKTGAIDFRSWYRKAFGTKTPWGDTDSPAFVTEVETALERELSRSIMRRGKSAGRVRLRVGETLVEQGERSDSIFLLLDGVLAVEVDGDRLAEVGPGAIVGERALLEGGTRTSTLRAVVPSRIAVVAGVDVDPAVLREISKSHRREEGQR